MRFSFFFVLANLVLQSTVFSQTKAINFETYCNDRYGYCIKYPTSLTPQPEAGNGDGRIFTNKKGIEVLRVYGARNEDDAVYIPLAKYYKMELNGGRFNEHPKRIITYSKLGKSFFVISGTENGKIFYQKTIEQRTQDDVTIAEAILQYTDGERELYSEVSKMIFSSFK